eukprot:1156011-Pelagomonas_calceolata.AAC.7
MSAAAAVAGCADGCGVRPSRHPDIAYATAHAERNLAAFAEIMTQCLHVLSALSFLTLQFAEVPFEEAPQLLTILTNKLGVTLPLVVRTGILQVCCVSVLHGSDKYSTLVNCSKHASVPVEAYHHLFRQIMNCGNAAALLEGCIFEAAAAAEQCAGTGNEVSVWSCIISHMLHVFTALQRPAYSEHFF